MEDGKTDLWSLVGAAVPAAARVTGLLIGMAYGFGLIAVASFYTRYGLQATELLRARYVIVGLLFMLPLLVGLGAAASASRPGKTIGQAANVGGMVAFIAALLMLSELSRGSGEDSPLSILATVSILYGTTTWFVYLVWHPRRLPTQPTEEMSAKSRLGKLFEAVFDWFGKYAMGVNWVFVVTGVLLLASTFGAYLPYVPAWAGGLRSNIVRVITEDESLGELLAGDVRLIESGADRYVFMVERVGSSGKTLSWLIEVPPARIQAIIAPHDRGQLDDSLGPPDDGGT